MVMAKPRNRDHEQHRQQRHDHHRKIGIVPERSGALIRDGNSAGFRLDAKDDFNLLSIARLAPQRDAEGLAGPHDDDQLIGGLVVQPLPRQLGQRFAADPLSLADATGLAPKCSG